MKRLSLCNKILFALNLMAMLLTLIAMGTPHIPVTAVPALSVLSLVAPLLVFVHGVFVLYWVLVRKPHFLPSAAVLALWYMALGPFYKFSGNTEAPQEGRQSLSVMSFNVRGFNKYGWIDNPELDNEIVSLIQRKKPSVLCFQEFSSLKGALFSQYPYRYETPFHEEKAAQVVLSQYPILNSGSLDFPDTYNNALYVDIAFGNDTLRLYNLHLQSFSIVPEMNTLAQEQSSQLFARFRSAMLKQYQQANLLREHMEKSPYKKIVAGDFNNTAYANVYKIVKGDMKDSFFEKGRGFGQTYKLWGFPIRIDYILADPALETVAHENFDQQLSDHYPVMATFRLGL